MKIVPIKPLKIKGHYFESLLDDVYFYCMRCNKCNYKIHKTYYDANWRGSNKEHYTRIPSCEEYMMQEILE